MGCEAACYESAINCCADILLHVGLTASTEYYVIISRSRTNEYQLKYTSDSTGDILILKSDLPAGFFSQGILSIKIKSVTTYEEVIMAINDLEYTCIIVNLIKINSTSNQFPIIGGATESGDEGEGGSSGVVNPTDIAYNQYDGLTSFIGGNVAAPNIMQFFIKNNPDDGYSYVSDEGQGFGVSGLFPPYTTNLERFTVGDVLLQWRVYGPGPTFTPLTTVNEKVLVITQLATRWYTLFKFTGVTPYNIYPGFGLLNFYNCAGVLNQAEATDIADFITKWNADPANVNFQIIDSRVQSGGWYQVRLEPDPSELIYPMQHIKVELAI